MLREGVKAARAGREGDARAAFRAALRKDPSNETALLWLAYLAEDPRASQAYIARVLEINPRNPRAHAALRWAGRRMLVRPARGASDSGKATSPGGPSGRPPETLLAVGRLATVGALFLLIALLGWVFALTVQAGSLPLVALAQVAPGSGRAAASPLSPSPPISPTAPLRTPAATALVPSPPLTPAESPTPLPPGTATPLPPTPAHPPPLPTPIAIQPTAAPTPIPLPPAHEPRWIDVDLSLQVLTAYEGHSPVRTVPVSTGLSRTPTPAGRYRIYVKHTYDDMAGPGYYLSDVPYVMYFHRGYGLHGTYWHTNFGQPMSHGCVNLPTPDAEWLFDWAGVGTLVNIHY